MLNRIMPTGKDQSSTQNDLIELVNKEGSPVKMENTANYINQFFTGVGAKLASKIRVDNSDYIDNLKIQLQTTKI